MSQHSTTAVELDAALLELEKSDTSLRKRAAALLYRRARGDWTGARKDWFSNPTNMRRILEELRTAPPSVAVELIGAAGAASQRFDVLAPEIRDTLLKLYPQAPDPVRIAIAQALPQFGTETVWDVILKTLDAKPTRAAQHTVALAVGRYGRTMPPSTRARASQLLLHVAANQVSPDIQKLIATAMADIGSSRSIPHLREWLRKAKSSHVREAIERTILALNSGTTTTPKDDGRQD